MLVTLRNSLIDPGVEGGLNRRQLEISSALRSFHCKVKSALHTGLKLQVSYQFFKSWSIVENILFIKAPTSLILLEAIPGKSIGEEVG